LYILNFFIFKVIIFGLFQHQLQICYEQRAIYISPKVIMNNEQSIQFSFFSAKVGPAAGDLHKNDPKVKEKHRLTLRWNYFTNLTLLCGAPPTGATHAHVTPFRPAPLSQPTWPPRR
jgi:hypothetical protein